MASRITVLRRVFGVLLVAALAYLGWLVAGVERRPPVALEDREAQDLPKGGQEYGVSEGVVLDWDGGAFRHLEAGRATKSADGSLALAEGLQILVERGDGLGTLVVRAQTGDLPPAESERVVVRGQVSVAGEDGFRLESEELEIDRQRKKLRSRKPVRFAQGEVTGEAGVLVHDWSTKESVLSGSPVLRLSGERTGGRDVTVTGADLRLDERRRRLEARTSATIEFPEGSISGAEIDIDLDPAADDLRRIAARRNAVTTTRSTSPSGHPTVRVLSAMDIVHEFAGASRLTVVHARGTARLVGTEAGNPEPVELVSGEVIRLTFSGAGATIPELVTAVGAPAHAEIQEPGRRHEVTALAIDASFDRRGALERIEATGSAATRAADAGAERRLQAERTVLSFSGEGARLDTVQFEGSPARLVERQGGPAGKERTVVANAGDVEVGVDGAVRAGHLAGSVQLGNGAIRAAGDEADVDEAGQTVLTGNASVETDGRISHGERVTWDSQGRRITISGGQHTIVRDAGAASGLGRLASGTEPTYISSDVLVVHEVERRADYSGGRPSLRRGDNQLVADTLSLDDAAGTLVGEGSVESQLRLATAADAPRKVGLFDPTRLVEGRSGTVRFDRATNVVTYGGGVRRFQGEAHLEADEVEIRLGDEKGRIETLEARGNATFKAPDREAEGETIDYRSSDCRTRVTSGRRPARARDGAGHWVTGGVLEMHCDEAGVSVTAPGGGRTRGGLPGPAAGAGAPPRVSALPAGS